MTFIEDLAIKTEQCNNELFRYFDETTKIHPCLTIFDAYRYSLQLPGKRLRMIILLEAAKLFSDNTGDCVPFACALEMIHTYSLIHDDLPAMDNALYRRGQLTSHKKFDEATAILAGDGLLTYAFEIMTQAALQNPDKLLPSMRAIQIIANGAGVNGMVLGQALDTQIQNKDVDLLHLINEKKTAALFISAMRAGAVMACAPEDAVSAVKRFGYHFGIAFQITDDILDITGDAKKTGKLSGNDADNDKHTVASILGVAKASTEANKHIQEAKNAIYPYDRFGFFTALCDFLLTRQA